MLINFKNLPNKIKHLRKGFYLCCVSQHAPQCDFIVDYNCNDYDVSDVAVIVIIVLIVFNCLVIIN